ncbi:eglA [Symbiodinium sp. CCMP2592]|nr:eglA [Symbiodinium sp. CCMP2592]
MAAEQTTAQPVAPATAETPIPPQTAPAQTVMPAPGIPVKSPPPELVKQEPPDAPGISRIINLTPDSQVVRFTNGIIHLRQAGKEPETISSTLYDALVSNLQAQLQPATSRGLRNGSTPATDPDPIEWGDMGPNFREALQNSPELFRAYNTVRNPRKMARLDPTTNSFTTTTNIDLPAPSVEIPPPQVTMENLSTVLAQYHEHTGVEADVIRRTVLIHGLPPFGNKDCPMRIERDLPVLERLERVPVHAVMNALTKPQNPSISGYLKCDLNSLQIWDPEETQLLAQVIYLPDTNLAYACHILIISDLFEAAKSEFPRYFGDKMASTIQFLQASASASRNTTTALRYHFTRTKDVSNVSREDAIKSFPYAIYPIEMGEELCTQLTKNPNFVLQGFLGMQPQIQQAVSDAGGLNLEDYGRKGKGSGNKGSRNKGKGKRSEYNKRWERPQDDEQEDSNQDYQRSGKGFGDRACSSTDTGKGSRKEWVDYSRPAKDRQWEPVEEVGPRSRSDRWWNVKDFENYDFFRDSTRRRREDDRQKGDGRQTRPRGRALDDPSLIFPCEDCMALAGTNTNCNTCRHKYGMHYEKLRRLDLLPDFQQAPVNKLPSFPCPFPLDDKGTLCDAAENGYLG